MSGFRVTVQIFRNSDVQGPTIGLYTKVYGGSVFDGLHICLYCQLVLSLHLLEV